MKNNIGRAFSFAFAAIIVGSLLITFVSSCKKDANAQFVGTYYGTRTLAGAAAADTIIITAGSTSTSVVINEKSSGSGSPALAGTVSGNNLTIPSQAVSFAGNAGTVTGAGTLSGSALSVTYTEVITLTNTPISGTFSGVKQ